MAALAVVPRVISLLNRTPKVNLRQEAPVETPVAEAPAVLEAVLKTRQVATPRRQNSHALLAETPSLQAWQSPSAARAPPLAGAETRSRAYLYRRSFPINEADPSGLDVSINGRQHTINGSIPYTILGDLIMAKDGSVDSFIVGGHSNGTDQSLSMEDKPGAFGHIKFSEGKLRLYGPATNGGNKGAEIPGFEDLLLRKLSPKAVVTFYGCNTGLKGGLAHWASTRLPNKIVASPEVVFQDGIPASRPFTSPDSERAHSHPGLFNAYQNSRLIEQGTAVPGYGRR